MKYNRYLLLLLLLCISICTRAQYNPENPDEPGARPWKLTLQANPAKAESFNRSKDTYHVAGEQIYIQAYDNGGFKFVKWEDEQGNVISTEHGFDYTMPARHVTLTARYDYSPDTPDEPGQASIKRHLYLRSNPQDGGYFNYGSTNDIVSGQQVTLQAYPNQYYSFRNWTKDGEIVSTSAQFVYTMPDKDATLTANFDYRYSPDNPDEPGAPQGERCNLYAMREGVLSGQTYTYSIYMENIGIEATGFSLEVNFPKGFTVDIDDISLTSRATNHTLKVEDDKNGTLHFVVSGATSIEGVAGKILEIPLHVPDTATVGMVFPVELKNGLVFKADGQQASIGVRSGSLQILRSADEKPDSPDYEVSDLQTTNSEVMPGDAIHLSWKVNNKGNIAGHGGWTERLYLVSTDGRKVCIGTVNYDTESLQPGAIVTRSADIILAKVLGIDGKADLSVTIVPQVGSGEISDYLTNNSVQTTNQPLSVGKKLYLSVPQTPQVEGAINAVRCQLSRSGNWSDSEEFHLTKLSGDDRIIIPETVTIPREQASAYFYIPFSDNAVCDIDSIVSFRIEGQDGYETVEGTFIVRDDELPPLRLTTSTTEVTEGESFRLTVNVDHPISSDLVVALTCDHPTRFSYPKTIILPKGQTTATVELTAINDSNPSNTETVEFFATTEGYEKAYLLLMLYDNDVPDISLELTPEIVSEEAGTNAVYAILKRTKVTNNKVTVRLTDDQEGRLVYPNIVVLEKDVTEKAITIGVIDNNLVDGECIVNLTAEVYISSCDCGVVGTKQGIVTRQLHLLDNDGPTLTLTSSQSTIREGDNGGAEITLTRNTQTNDKLIVMLHSENAGVMLPTQVTIPAGERSTTFLVRARANDLQEGSRAVVIRANADGYNTGAMWLYITDTTLPDMAVKSVEVTPATILAGDDYNANVTIANTGVVAVPARSTYTINTSNQTFTMTLPEAIAPNDVVTMSLMLKAPDAPGNYTVEVECNKDRTFDEVQWLNNMYSVPLKVSPAYIYTITTDRTSYQIGQTVKISGQATALKDTAQGITVEPYVIYHGTRQALTATTDAEGRFETDYQLPAGVGGDFAVGVCAPNENSSETAITFGVYGMARTSASYIKSYMYVDEPYTIKVPIKNLSSLPLHHIKVSVSDNEGHYRVTAKEITTLDGYAEGEMELTMVSDAVTTTKNWERVWINLVSEEGATLNFVVYNYTTYPGAELVLDHPVIKANIANNKPTTIPIVLTNRGVGKTGRITISIPKNQAFVTLNTPQELPSMANNDSTTISLTFNPVGLPTNIVQTGTIAINCENSDGQLISYSLKVVGEDKGNLFVSVEDEFTIYGNAKGERPLVAGASVQLKDYNTGVALYTATTTKEGTVLFNDIPEGYYTLFVTAPKHDSYMQHVYVSPAETTEHLATLSYQAISINWNVEETTVEDQYEIVSEYAFETQVPVPVVVLDTPDELNLYDVEMGHELLYYIKVENQGLITAQNVCVSLPSHDDFLFTPLSEYAGFDLAAKQSVTIPVLVTYAPNGNQSRARRAGGEKKSKCHDYTWANWEWVCKSDRTGWIGKVGKFLMRACDPDAPTPKDPKPDNRKVIEPKYPDSPNAEPQLRYWTAEQPDLELLKEIISTIACGMSCALPRNIPEIFKPNLKEIKKCVKEELTHRHNKSRQVFRNAASEQSLRDLYLDRLSLYIDLNMNVCNYYAELANAPQLMNDPETFNLLMPSMDSIVDLMDELHSKGMLYNTSVSNIAQTAMTMMPQQSADWFDFNLTTFIERQMNTFRKFDNLIVDGENFCNVVTLDTCMANKVRLEQELISMGYIDYIDMINAMNRDAEAINSDSKSVCATVKIQIKQELAFTRQAFRGTLTIENSTENALTNITALIQATSEDGTLATNREMQINLENFKGFTEQDNGSYRLEAGQSGTFTFIFIPTKYAATDHDVVYSFGGALTFNNGEGVMTRELYPVSLIVRPSPELDLTYFMQRDVYGDDPLTEEMEPVVPAEFALLINNKGYGDATNVRMVTQQPKIIENEKGLLIDFQLVSSQVNGEAATLSFGETIANDFGTIPARSQSYAQWWLTSSLLGHFTDYDVKATHATSYGNEDLSLLDEVTVHELIHGFTVSNSIRGFLVNDIVDAEDTPDMVYFTNASQKNVSKAASVNINELSPTQYQLTVMPSSAGWSYASLPDPTGGKLRLTGVIRQSDGESLPVDNIWQTWYTLRDGKDPVHEKRLHVVANLPGGSETYLLMFEPRPDMELEVERFDNAPLDNEQINYAIKEVSVVFNKPIQQSTFSTDDLSLAWQGEKLDVSRIAISQISDKEYNLNMEELTNRSGYYVLTVYTEDIMDTDGFYGSKNQQLAWTQVVDGSGIKSLQADGQLSVVISPMPVSDWMRISGNFKSINKLSVYSLNGTTCFQMRQVHLSTIINMSKLTPGLYIVSVQTDLGTYRTRIIKE